MKSNRLILTFACLATLNGCAGPYKSTGSLFTEPVATSQTKAVVYILRTHHGLGSAIWPNVYFNQKHIADIKNGTYTIVYAQPGSYEIRTEMDPQFFYSTAWPSKATFQFEAGRRYYVQLYRDIQEPKGVKIFGSTFVHSDAIKVLGHELRSLPETDALTQLKYLRYEHPKNEVPNQ